MPALKRCPCLKAGALLVGLAFGGFLAAGLRDAHDLDAAALAQRQVSLAEEAAIRRRTAPEPGRRSSCGARSERLDMRAHPADCPSSTWY